MAGFGSLGLPYTPDSLSKMEIGFESGRATDLERESSGSELSVECVGGVDDCRRILEVCGDMDSLLIGEGRGPEDRVRGLEALSSASYDPGQSSGIWGPDMYGEVRGAAGRGDYVAPENLIEHLPDECLALVFRKLDTQNASNVSLVCKRWWSVDADCRSHLVLRATADISPQLPLLLRRFVGVTKLVLKCERQSTSIDDAALLSIALHCPQLKKLKLKNCKQVTDEGMAAFAASGLCLRKFSCGSCGFGGVGLNALLQTCPTLEDLTIKRSMKAPHERVPEVLTPGKGMLRRLCLKDQSTCHIWSNLIAGSPKLETLILARNNGNWDKLLEVALGKGELPNLSQLYLERVDISDAGLAAIARCHKLEALVVVKASECTDIGLQSIALGCPNLRRLHVEGWAANHIGDAGLNSIVRNCRLLQEVVLVGHSITVSSLYPLATTGLQIERLTLCSSEVLGDAEVAVLAGGCGYLRRLCIKGCPRVTDLGIIALANGCASLQKLKIRRCEQVSFASINFLKLHRPEVQIQLGMRADEGEGDEDGREVVLLGGEREGNGNGIVRRLGGVGAAGERGRQRFARTRQAIAAGGLLMRRLFGEGRGANVGLGVAPGGMGQLGAGGGGGQAGVGEAGLGLRGLSG